MAKAIKINPKKLKTLTPQRAYPVGNLMTRPKDRSNKKMIDLDRVINVVEFNGLLKFCKMRFI